MAPYNSSVRRDFFMTSKERKDARYKRRKQKRILKKQLRCDSLGSIGDVFSYRKMFLYGKKCCKGVRWKRSTQNFELHLFSKTAKATKNIVSNSWVPMKYTRFTLRERGKTRQIDAPHISDRQIHKLISNDILIPLYSPSMIYDNGASQRNKGLHWHYNRLKEHIRWHYKRYGTNGHIILIDLKGFFPNAPHSELYKRHNSLILSDDIRNVCDLIIKNSSQDSDFGMPLGVEPSQQEMVSLPSNVDNFAKCQLGIHCFGHYMDDYYMIVPNKSEANLVMSMMMFMFESMGMQVNQNKCKIIPMNNPFKFCKVKFRITETGRIVTNGSRDGVKRFRNKAKKLKQSFDSGLISKSEIDQVLNSHISYYKNFNDYGRIKSIRKIYIDMFR